MSSTLDGAWLGLGAAGALAVASALRGARGGSRAKREPKGPVEAENYKIRRETYEEQQAAGRHNPARVLILPSGIPRITGKVRLHEGALVPHLANTRVALSAGDRDNVSVWRWGDDYFVISENWGLEYIGMQRISWDGSRWEESGEVFLQGNEQIVESLGPKGLDYTDRTKVIRLEPYTAQG